MIKTNFRSNYGFDPIRAFNFTPYLERLEGISIYYGIDVDEDLITTDKNYKVKINLETPNFIYSYDTYKEYSSYDLILHLCPYTCNYLNKKYSTSKYKPIFFPSISYNLNNNIDRTTKLFYTGGKHSLYPIDIIYSIMNKYIGIDEIKRLNSNMASNNIQGYYDKLTILSNTKICLVHNVLANSRMFPNHNEFKDDALCKDIFPWHTNSDLVPQLKSRVFEGALMGCILLVYKDKYNIIEKYFSENIDFLYFENYDDLDNKVKTILDNYNSYKYLAENARNKVINNYMIKNLVDIILEYKLNI